METKRLKNNKFKLSVAELMPASEAARKILQERANYFAKTIAKKQESDQVTHYVSFRLGANEKYGIPFHYINEVMQNIIITPLPSTPEFIAGVINRRSNLIAALDLKPLFHIKPSEDKPHTLIIVVQANDMTIGLLADDILGSSTYTNLTAPIASEGIINANYILGLHNGEISILNIENILSDMELNNEIAKYGVQHGIKFADDFFNSRFTWTFARWIWSNHRNSHSCHGYRLI